MYISTLKSYFCNGTSIYTGKCDLVMNADFLPKIFVTTVFCVICHITVYICSQYVGPCTVHRTLYIFKNLNSDLNLAIQQIQYWPTFCLLVHYSIYAGNTVLRNFSKNLTSIFLCFYVLYMQPLESSHCETFAISPLIPWFKGTVSRDGFDF